MAWWAFFAISTNTFAVAYLRMDRPGLAALGHAGPAHAAPGKDEVSQLGMHGRLISHSKGRLPRRQPPLHESHRGGSRATESRHRRRPGGGQMFARRAPGRLRSLVYVKTPKTGGSTFSGVVRRIGARRNYSHVTDAYWLDDGTSTGNRTSRPSLWANHGHRSKLDKNFLTMMPGAFYITSVRNPTERFMSWYYHIVVGRVGKAASQVQPKLSAVRNANPSLQTDYVRRTETQTAHEAFASYDFVLVTERFDESLLALKKAAPWLQLSWVDLLYLKAKESGKPATGDEDTFMMPEHVPLSKEPEVVRNALASTFSGSDDETLVKLAHEALDKYGLANTSEYKQFQKMLRRVEKACRSHFNDDCLWNDNGCGQTCIDAVVRRHGWK